MPVIQKRTTKTRFVRHITRLYSENNETLFAYAAFIEEHTEHVLNELVETVLARDKEFLKWRETHRGPFVRKPSTQARRVSTEIRRPTDVASVAHSATNTEA